MGVTTPFPSPDAIARAELLTRERFLAVNILFLPGGFDFTPIKALVGMSVPAGTTALLPMKTRGAVRTRFRII